MSWLRRSWMIPLFILAAASRLSLAFINRWANDDHMDVVFRILSGTGMPKVGECPECHHPKLFYLCTAALVDAFSLPPGDQATLAAQLLNVTLSIAALALFGRFLAKLAVSQVARNLVFATVALNPCWWGISAQATNDSMVIAFGLAAFVLAFAFFRKPSGERLLACALCCALAAVSKASGILVTLLVGFNIGLSLLSERKRTARAVLLSRWGLGALLLLAPVPVLGGYLQNQRIAGDPFALIAAKHPAPSFLEEASYGRPGIKSVVSGYLTFRIVDVIAHPYTDNGQEAVPVHRSSMGSRLYGLLFFSRFDSWPPAWESRNPRVLSVGRAALTTALAALVVFCWGWLSSLRSLWRSRSTLWSQPLGEQGFLRLSGLVGTSIAFLAMLKATSNDRNFYAIKFIYLLPVLFSFAAVYLSGWTALAARHRTLLRILVVPVSILMLVHLVDMGLLISDLARLRGL